MCQFPNTISSDINIRQIVSMPNEDETNIVRIYTAETRIGEYSQNRETHKPSPFLLALGSRILCTSRKSYFYDFNGCNRK